MRFPSAHLVIAALETAGGHTASDPFQFMRVKRKSWFEDTEVRQACVSDHRFLACKDFEIVNKKVYYLLH